jgi:hypothetical protein
MKRTVLNKRFTLIPLDHRFIRAARPENGYAALPEIKN